MFDRQKLEALDDWHLSRFVQRLYRADILDDWDDGMPEWAPWASDDSVDIALKLPMPKSWKWRFVQTSYGWKAFAQKEDDNGNLQAQWLCEGDGQTLARAICIAWATSGGTLIPDYAKADLLRMLG